VTDPRFLKTGGWVLSTRHEDRGTVDAEGSGCPLPPIFLTFSLLLVHSMVFFWSLYSYLCVRFLHPQQQLAMA